MALGGILVPLSLAPFYYWPLAMVGMLAPMLLCQQRKLSHNLLLAWCFGVGLNGLGVSWIYVSIHQYGSASVPLAVFLTSMFVAGLALFAMVPVFLWRKYFSRNSFAIVPLWTLQEWLRSWLLTGFPWLQLGDAHTETWLAGYAPVIGSLGVSFLVLLIAYSVFLAWTNPAKRYLSLASIPVIFVFGFVLQQVSWTQAKAAPLSVALVQGNIPQDVKWNRQWADKIVGTYKTLTEDQWGQDLVVWPEMAITQFKHRSPELLAELTQRAKETETALVAGIPILQRNIDGEAVLYNSAIVLGQGQGQYFKRQLVPFGDYVPFQQWLRGLIEFFNLPMSYAQKGPNEQAPMLIGGHQVVMAICYEIAYAQLVAASVPDPSFIITISNDTWFGGSIGPWQHLQLARMRALENAKPVIRATNDGVSAIIAANGAVVATGPQFQAAVIRGEVQGRSGITPFSRWQHYPILLLCFVLLGLGWWQRSRSIALV